jgi:hypothetical protein
MPDRAGQIRHAIERGEYACAGSLWQAWAADLAGKVGVGAADPGEWAQASELYLWSRAVLLAERAHLLAEVNAAHAAAVYGRPLIDNSATLVHGKF